MFDEKGCLENLKHILSEYTDDENIKHLSLADLRSSYAEIADNMYCISPSNRLKYKNILWNIDNLRADIRLKFQTELFNTWHSIYMQSVKAHPIENRPDIKSPKSTLVEGVEINPKIDAKEQTPVFTGQHPTSVNTQKRMATIEDTNLSLGMKPVKERSSVSVQKVSVQKFENDWFDKLLDFFAAMVGKK